ncbi:MAG: two-component sensor histidine kinase, partial [Nostoc sp.]
DGIDVKAIFPPKAGITGKRNTQNQLRLVLSAPVSDSRRNLVYSLSIQSALYQQTRNPPGSLTGAMVVIAEDGTILAHPFTDWVGTNINQHPNADQLQSIIKNALGNPAAGIAGQNDSI